MDFPVLNSPEYKGYFLRLDPEKEIISLFNSEGDFIKSVKMEDLISLLLESKGSIRRKNLRTSLSLKIKYQGLPGSWEESITGTLGTGGLFIETPVPYEKGAKVSIQFNLPDTPRQLIEATGKVVWTRTRFEKVLHFPGMGIEFSDISNEQKTAIRHLIQAINKSRGIE
ncbi:MAG: PilZ domain-containing protein [Nitrospiria bacterium]